MGLFDWLLSDPTQSDGGFLARLLLDQKPGAGVAATDAPSALTAGNGGLLGESPLVNLLRSGFAGMNAANGYTGFGPQFAAGVRGGADAMALRRQQMIDQINALKLKQALAAKAGMPGAAGDGAADGSDASSDGSSGVGAAIEDPADRACPACAGAGPVSPKPNLPLVQSDAEYVALPSGSQYLDPFGRIRVKP
jgi:hypothetical protein